MKHLTTTQKTAAVAVLALIASCALYAFVYKAIDGVGVELVEARAELDRLHVLAENREKAHTLVKDTDALHDELHEYLLETDDPNEFLALMEAAARDAGVALTVESLSEEKYEGEEAKKQQATVYVRIVVAVEGSWAELYHLIELLETIPYGLTIDRVLIQQSSLESGDYGWSGQLHLAVGIYQ